MLLFDNEVCKSGGGGGMFLQILQPRTFILGPKSEKSISLSWYFEHFGVCKSGGGGYVFTNIATRTFIIVDARVGLYICGGAWGTCFR